MPDRSGRPLRWGIVGFGWVAQDFMVPAIAAAGDRLVAVADPDPDARRAAERLGAKAYPEAALLAADPGVEAVYVATPNHRHREPVELLSRAGKAVLCEKPMAATLADATRMAETVRRAGVLYGTAFDQRHHPAHRAMREAIRSGAIGTPTAVRIVYACWVGSDWSAASGRENWRVDAAKAGGGALIDLAPHGLDLVEFLLGEPIEAVSAVTQSRVQGYAVDDGAIIIGTTRSGTLATLHVAYNCPEALPRRRLEIVGSKAMLAAENTMGQDAGGRVGLIDGSTAASAELEIPDRGMSPFEAQVRAFGSAFRSGKWDAFSAERDLQTMRLIAEAYANAGKVSRLSLPGGEGESASADRGGTDPGRALPTPDRSSASTRPSPPGRESPGMTR